MRKTLFYFCALIAPLVFVNAAEPDTSNINTFQEAIEILDSQPVTYLDLKLEQANRLLNCEKYRIYVLPYLDPCGDGFFLKGTYSYEPQKSTKLICHVILTTEFPNFIYHKANKKFEYSENIYEHMLLFTKKHIHHTASDDNLIVIMSVCHKYVLNEQGHYYTERTDPEVIAKWEDGQPTYYKRFFRD